MSHRRLRHLPFSLGSGTNGAKLVLHAPAMRGYADGDPVGTWSDISGNSKNATASGSARPTYQINELGGMPVVQFVTDDIMETSALTLTNWAFISVFKASNNGLIYEISANTNVNRGGFLYTDIYASYAQSGSSGGTASTYNISPGWAANNVWRICSHFTDGTNAGHLFYVNGTSPSATNVFTSNPGSPSFSEQVFVGCRSGGVVAPLNGSISFIVGFGSATSAAKRQRIQQSCGFTFRIATK